MWVGEKGPEKKGKGVKGAEDVPAAAAVAAVRVGSGSSTMAEGALPAPAWSWPSSIWETGSACARAVAERRIGRMAGEVRILRFALRCVCGLGD